jgi:transcriptional regulator with XRE-family HTH domain
MVSRSALRIVPYPGSLRSFGALLRCQREVCHVGLRQLARDTGLSHSYLSRVERDLVLPPSAATIRRLAQALHMDAARLLAVAGVISDEVMSFFFRRPEVATVVFNLVSTLTDEEIEALCDDLAARHEPVRLASKDGPRTGGPGDGPPRRGGSPGPVT